MADSHLTEPKLQPTTSQEKEPPERDEETQDVADNAADAPETSKKKKKRKGKGKATETSGTNAIATTAAKPNHAITSAMTDKLLDMNPALAADLGNIDRGKAKEILKHMDVNELMTGMSLGGKNKKDMDSYKFWQTQPVPRFDEKPNIELADGPIKEEDPEKIPKQPDTLIEGFDWCTLDLNKEDEIIELYELLSNHYVEDENAMFRFNYSQAFFNWALKSPGWRPEWHVGVRATRSRKLVASICAVPTQLRVRKNSKPMGEVNFLCIHKKLRSKRLAPVLIKEVTRRINLDGIYQAIYTAGIILPRPVSSCRYFHRPINWLKLYETGFSPMPAGATKERMIRRNQLPPQTNTPGFRPMQESDIDAVLNLLNRYLSRFDLAQEFTRDEVDHWLFNKTANPHDRVIWSFVADGDGGGPITDFVSFYSLESSVIQAGKHASVRAAYLYYYATETAFVEKERGLRERLQILISDALIEAKKANFDVFNALTLLDNPLFLEQLKFGPGDGQLHFYLFNWRTAPIMGGVNERNQPDERRRGGVGMVML